MERCITPSLSERALPAARVESLFASMPQRKAQQGETHPLPQRPRSTSRERSRKPDILTFENTSLPSKKLMKETPDCITRHINSGERRHFGASVSQQ
jgi:hypothetical protein